MNSQFITSLILTIILTAILLGGMKGMAWLGGYMVRNEGKKSVKIIEWIGKASFVLAILFLIWIIVYPTVLKLW